MASDLTTEQIIETVLRLPLKEQGRIYDALHESLVDDMIDHGPEEPADDVEAAWSQELARRIADIDSGKVKTIPSEEAWKMIDGQTPPTF
jgi:putative addiction module component (TIGR02574 family)